MKNNQNIVDSAQNVIDEINALPKIEELKLDDLEKVNNTKKLLKSELLPQIENFIEKRL